VLSQLARWVASQPEGNRNSGLFWAANRALEADPAADLSGLATAARQAGLEEPEILEINPTYHFTIDGRRDSLYDAEYVATIKRMERNSAVYQLVRAWADYLQGEDTLFKSRDERILFGCLLTVEANAAIDEKAWLPPPDSPAPAPADSGLLAGLWDLPA